jgi:DMSO/TMAO reductase YedYZ molybdopterin-dependent catalytic subunit
VIQKTRPQRSPRRPPLPDAVADRLPPGQFFTPRWPVLHQGDVPAFDPCTWNLSVFGLVDNPRMWRWEAFAELPTITVAGDLHCVTRWSTLDHVWQGVAPATIAEAVAMRPEVRFVLLHGEGGYSANLPLEVFLAADVVLATHHAGEPLTPEHGAPLRAVVPSRYAWKSVKWLRGIEFLAEDRPGFWEGYGYSNSADPWREERFES